MTLRDTGRRWQGLRICVALTGGTYWEEQPAAQNYDRGCVVHVAEKDAAKYVVEEAADA